MLVFPEGEWDRVFLGHGASDSFLLWKLFIFIWVYSQLTFQGLAAWQGSQPAYL